ncbi:MAG: hypothetical protein AAGC77_05865 [Pseudomonadota bacterium]
MMPLVDEPLIILIAVWIAFAASYAGARLAAESEFLPDDPNHRSSHDRRTSRAGGLAIMTGWLLSLTILGVFSNWPGTLAEFAALAGLSAFACLVGFADDRWRMPALLKLGGQVVVAVGFVVFFGGLSLAPAPFAGEVSLDPILGAGLTIFWIVAFMNAFNFMDGANGIAAGAACIGLTAFAIIGAYCDAPFAAATSLLLATTCFGFLPSNLARGRLFMGDSGSQAVGFIIAALAVIGANSSDGRVSALIMPMIFMPFLFDVLWTLVHRTARGRNILVAHREHLYQLLLRTGHSHTAVAVIYMSLTALSAAAAIFMLALPPAYQWVAPVLLAAVFMLIAMRTHLKAEALGFFDDGDEDEDAIAAAHSSQAQSQQTGRQAKLTA